VDEIYGSESMRPFGLARSCGAGAGLVGFLGNNGIEVLHFPGEMDGGKEREQVHSILYRFSFPVLLTEWTTSLAGVPLLFLFQAFTLLYNEKQCGVKGEHYGTGAIIVRQGSGDFGRGRVHQQDLGSCLPHSLSKYYGE
jgi:hypothetical protein